MERLREPIRTLVGKFEAQLLREGQHGQYYRELDDSLYAYFFAFPRKSSPEQFSLADTEDWRIWEADKGRAYSVIRKRLCHIKSFFSWLIEEVPGYEELANPVVVPAWPPRDEHTNPDVPSSRLPARV